MEQRTCTCCGRTKPLDAYNPSKNATRGFLAYCKECARAKQRDWYKRNRDKKLANDKVAVRRIRPNARQAILAHLQRHPCVDCGESDPMVLDFDHINGDKAAAVSTLVYQDASVARILQEVGKCEVRCANCHRRKAAKQHGWYWFADPPPRAR